MFLSRIVQQISQSSTDFHLVFEIAKFVIWELSLDARNFQKK